MYPIICKIGPLTVYSYGLMLALAFLAGAYLTLKQARKEKINPEAVFNLLFVVFISGVIGARIFYIIENIGYYAKNLNEIAMFSRGGLSWFGGLIAGIASAIIYLKKRELTFYKTADLIVPFADLAQGIGRIGCFLNGCCFGKVSYLIPTQIISSLILVFIFIVLRYLQDRPHKTGSLFFTYLLLYSTKRFFIEFWRQDNPVIFYGLTLFQALCVLVFGLALVKLFLIRKSGQSH